MSIIEREGQVVPEVHGPITEREHRARTLEAAALEIEVRGWNRGEFCDAGGAVCVLGGVLFALGLDPKPREFDWGTLEVAARAWGFSSKRGDFDPMQWNDHKARDAADATFLLRWRAEEIRDGR